MLRDRRLDTIGPGPTLWRKIGAFRCVAQRRADVPEHAAELLDTITRLQREQLHAAELGTKVRALWQMERLGCTFARVAAAGDSLDDPRLDPSVAPIAHVGMGVGAVEQAGFERAAIEARIEQLAAPSLRAFAYESVGAMLGVYARTLPRALVGLRPLERPALGPFVTGFSAEQRRLIAHGYGRLLYFDSPTLAWALRRAARLDALDHDALVRGIGFAHVMVNHVELRRALASACEDRQRSAMLAEGMCYALVFLAWIFPTTLEMLDTLDMEGAAEPALVERARVGFAAARDRGSLDAFGLC